MEKIGATQLAASENKNKDKDAPKIHAGDIMERILVEQAGVQLDRGYRFGAGGENFLRMNVGTSRVLLKRALDNITNATRAS
jgi:cystathionine beta-lyase